MNEVVDYKWGSSRRYNSYADWFVRQFGYRVQKVSVNAGFSCPNRDGTKGSGGCTYCLNEAFIPAYCRTDLTVTEQIKRGIEFHSRRYRRAGGYLAYFQAYTNTYAGIERLRDLYEEALSYPGIKGIVIGTRPDCVNDQLLDYLARMSEKFFVIVEYGIETVNDTTLKNINRGHDFAVSSKAVLDTASRGIKSGAHLIFGLPGDTRQGIIESADKISALPLNSIKIRQLQLIKDTVMAGQYRENPSEFDLYSLEEYLDLLSSFVEKLNPGIMVERISGEAPPVMLADPRDWHMRSGGIMRLFEQKLEACNTWQGRLYKGGS